MPEMGGYEATKAIREWEKHLGIRSAIIAMTANAMQGDREAMPGMRHGWLRHETSRPGSDSVVERCLKLLDRRHSPDQFHAQGVQLSLRAQTSLTRSGFQFKRRPRLSSITAMPSDFPQQTSRYCDH